MSKNGARERKMVGLEGETSNHLLDTLAEWNTFLEQHVPYFRDEQAPVIGGLEP